MTDQHQIIPPPELVQGWWEEADQCQDDPKTYFYHVATQAARWGADQELKDCYEWVVRDWTDIQSADMLLAARRPKPLSPRELALATLRKLSTSSYPCNLQQDEDWDTIRQALEQLDD
jgi:hypothetical protein